MDAPLFDLELTIASGQVFHWVRECAGFLGTIGDVPVYVEQAGEKLRVTKGQARLVAHYFALDHPLQAIYDTFPADPAMTEALQFCRGLRIVRQPRWECLATFITSSMKQVAHIAQISHTLRRRFGRRVTFGSRELWTYPTAQDLAKLTEADLRACALGYRAKNLLGAAKHVASGEVDLDQLDKLPDDEARAELCRLPGVGEKIANCALLFAFERVQAFPIDVWIERILREIYFRGKRRVTAGRLREFSATYFGAYGGYAQQYLFHHARKTWREREKQTALRTARKSARGRKRLTSIVSHPMIAGR